MVNLSFDDGFAFETMAELILEKMRVSTAEDLEILAEELHEKVDLALMDYANTHCSEVGFTDLATFPPR